MFRHHLSSALRDLRRFKSFSAISVLGLALGLACFIAAYGAVTYFTHGDREFKDIGRVYLIVARYFADTPAASYDTGFLPGGPGAAAQYLPVEAPELAAVASLSPLPAMRVDVSGRMSFVDAAWADPALLDIFPLPFVRSAGAQGANPPSAASHLLSEPRQAILSEAAALRLFGTTAAVGRVLTLESALDVTVAAVMKPFPPTSHFYRVAGAPGLTQAGDFGFELLISRETYQALQAALEKREAGPGGPQSPGAAVARYTYVMLPRRGGFTVAKLNQRLQGFDRRHGLNSPIQQIEYRAEPVARLRLDALQRAVSGLHPGISLAALVMSVVGLVLAIACVNYINLAIVRSLARAREIGIRCVLGASRLHVAAQHLTESALQVVLAALLALVILAGVAWAVDARTELDLTGAIASSARFWIGIALACLVAALVSGVYPAVRLASLRPAWAIRSGDVLASPRAGLRLIVIAQFAIASLLLTALAVVRAQNAELRETGMSAGADRTVVLGHGWSSEGASLETWRQALSADPAIESVAAIASPPWSNGIENGDILARGLHASHVGAISDLVSRDFHRALGMRLAAGRAFDLTDASPASNEVVIDRALAQALGFESPRAAIDQIVYELTPDLRVNGTVRIAGVVENQPMRILSLFGTRSRNIYHLMTPEQSHEYGQLVVRVSKNAIPHALATIDATWRRLSNTPIDREFMDELFERAYRTQAYLDRVLTALTLAGCLIAMMSVFGMALFVAERRVHEIGVRKAIGARPEQIIAMLMRDFSRPIVIANLVSWPLAYLAIEDYLSFFSERIRLSPLPFGLGLAVTLAMAWIAVYGQAQRAARVEPAAVLRHE